MATETHSLSLVEAEKFTRQVMDVFTAGDANPIEGLYALTASAMILSRLLNDIEGPVPHRQILKVVKLVQDNHAEEGEGGLDEA